MSRYIDHKKIFGTQGPSGRPLNRGVLGGPAKNLYYYNKEASGSNYKAWGPWTEALEKDNWNYIIPGGLTAGTAKPNTTVKNPDHVMMVYSYPH